MKKTQAEKNTQFTHAGEMTRFFAVHYCSSETKQAKRTARLKLDENVTNCGMLHKKSTRNKKTSRGHV